MKRNAGRWLALTLAAEMCLAAAQSSEEAREKLDQSDQADQG